MDIHFLETQYGSDDYGKSCDLRNEILRKPLGMNLFDEDLEEEKDFIHLIGKNEEAAVLSRRSVSVKANELEHTALITVASQQGEDMGTHRPLKKKKTLPRSSRLRCACWDGALNTCPVHRIPGV